MRRTSSIIPCKKDNLSVYNIRKVCFASLLSFLKNKKHFQQGDQIRQKKEFDGTPAVSQSLSGNAISRHEKKIGTRRVHLSTAFRQRVGNVLYALTKSPISSRWYESSAASMRSPILMKRSRPQDCALTRQPPFTRQPQKNNTETESILRIGATTGCPSN